MSGTAKRPREPRPYILPDHPTEVDRLDIQHYALRGALGSNYSVPLVRPTWVLDAGCGTGLWACELATEFPGATVVGLDLNGPSHEPPPNAVFVRADLLKRLPFGDGRFDFVHQRLLMPGVPLRTWSSVVAELARVVRPGGWLQLVETAPGPQPAGPATERLYEMLRRLGRQFGLDTTGIVFRSMARYLQDAGLSDVRVRQIDIPYGPWGGRIGSFFASDHRALFTRLGPVFRDQFSLSSAEHHELLTASLQELDEYRTNLTFGIGVGRRPR